MRNNYKITIYMVLTVLMIIALSVGLYYLLRLTKHPLMFYLLTLLLVSVIAVCSFEQNEKKLSALLAIIVFPYVGMLAVCYVILTKSRKKENFVRLESDKTQINALKEINTDYYKLAKFVEAKTGFGVLKGEKTEFYSDGTEFLQDIIKEISKAQKSIFLEFYIVKHGYLFSRLESEIYLAIKRGVKVELTVDSAGTGNFCKTDSARSLTSSGVKISVYKPINAPITFNDNIRTHRKLALIDEKIGYIGGINFSDDYEKHIKDGGLKLFGEAAKSLSGMMSMSIINCEKKVVQSKVGDGFLQPFAVNGRDVLEGVFSSMLFAAKKSVIIVTPYLSFSERIKNTIKYLIGVGISVTVMLPPKNTKIIYLINRAYARELKKSGAKILSYTPSFLHEKLVLIDDELALVGSGNFDLRSASYQNESAVLIYKHSVINNIIDDYLEAEAYSRELGLEDLNGRGLVKVLNRPLKYLGYLV